MSTTGPTVPVTTAAKAWVAGIGSTLTAIQTALAVAMLVASDGQLDGGEIGTLVTAGITMVATVYGVWKTTNQPVRSNLSQPTTW